MATAVVQDEPLHNDGICHICADPEPKFWVVGPCNHRVCWMCSLRLRVLYKQTACPMCKVSNDQVFVGKATGDKTFAKYTAFPSMPNDANFGLILESEPVQKAVKELLALTCPVRGCRNSAFHAKADVRRHIQMVHSPQTVCDICMAHKKVFAREVQVFASTFALQKHQKDHHPVCKVCGTLFFSEDERDQHYREKHEKCHICHRSDPSSQPYYRDYYSLEEHFRREHYLCPERLCLDLKFVVFASELEYKSHVAEVHLAHTKMQRSQRDKLASIDPSFMLATGSSARPNDRRPARQREESPRFPTKHQPPPETAVPQQVQQPVVDSSKLFFGDAIASLAGRLASLSLYEERNEEFLRSLRDAEGLSAAAIEHLQGACKQYQESRIAVQIWVQRVWDQIGAERASRIAPLLVELQLGSAKKSEMGRAVQAHINRLQAFPPLPQTASSSSSPVTQKVSSGNRPPAVKKIVVPAGKTIRLVSSPKSSVSYLGSGFGTGSRAKGLAKPSAAPVFSQAAAAGTGKAMASVATAKPLPAVNRDEALFPSLPGSKKAATPQPAASSNAFASPEDGSVGSFVVGGGSESTNTEATQPSKSRKKGKGQVVLRFG